MPTADITFMSVGRYYYIPQRTALLRRSGIFTDNTIMKLPTRAVSRLRRCKRHHMLWLRPGYHPAPSRYVPVFLQVLFTTSLLLCTS
jgi:hypothetical protein